MNKVTFVVGLDRGKYIQQEVEAFPGNKSNWEFEVTNEEGIDWIRVTIQDMTNLDALMLFHAGVEAGSARIKAVFVEADLEAQDWDTFGDAKI